MKGAGMGRLQQRFNAALVTVLTLAGLHGLAGSEKAAKGQAAKGYGHPLQRKFLRADPMLTNARGTEYPGYCVGRAERSKRAARIFAAGVLS